LELDDFVDIDVQIDDKGFYFLVVFRGLNIDQISDDFETIE